MRVAKVKGQWLQRLYMCTWCAWWVHELMTGRMDMEGWSGIFLVLTNFGGFVSTLQLWELMMRKSAGTLSPNLTSTRSPSTNSSARMVLAIPSLMTKAFYKATMHRSRNLYHYQFNMNRSIVKSQYRKVKSVMMHLLEEVLYTWKFDYIYN